MDDFGRWEEEEKLWDGECDGQDGGDEKLKIYDGRWAWTMDEWEGKERHQFRKRKEGEDEMDNNWYLATSRQGKNDWKFDPDARGQEHPTL